MIQISNLAKKPDFAVAVMKRRAALEIFQQKESGWFAAATAAAFWPSWLSFLAHCSWGLSSKYCKVGAISICMRFVLENLGQK